MVMGNRELLTVDEELILSEALALSEEIKLLRN